MSDSYQVRISAKARSVSLRMSIEQGLEVVVPIGYDLKRVPDVVARKKLWIDRTRKRFAEYQATAPAQPQEKLPSQIQFAAIGESWVVEYVPTNSATVRLREGAAGQLVLTGNISSELACRRLLRRWLIRRAEQTLVPWLRKVSEELNLPFNDASVRLQRTRWGSCSRRKNINLNARLLFLRPELVRYLFIHELCHLVHMNHSIRYWNFVASREPNYEGLDQEMRKAMKVIPHWV